jgi:hypothetical protein
MGGTLIGGTGFLIGNTHPGKRRPSSFKTTTTTAIWNNAKWDGNGGFSKDAEVPWLTYLVFETGTERESTPALEGIPTSTTTTGWWNW